MDFEQLKAAALAWLGQDPDPETRAELEDILAENDRVALQSRFGSRIGFGTAGLRGELGAGPNRMNRVLVAQAAAGLARHLSEVGGKTVVIGYDGRHNSDVFARDSAAIFAGAGLQVLLFDSYVPTPMLAFATKLGPLTGPNSGRSFDIGVMVTASHNPPRDNGYKVYAGALGGSQIVSPIDTQISAHIEAVAATQLFQDIPKSDAFEIGGAEHRSSYIAHTAGLLAGLGGAAAKATETTFTAMHGVGWETTRRVFEQAGLDLPHVVPAQIEPDGDFPTVAFPNPEEPGALDLAMVLASSNGSKLIIAEDPDADRLAVAVPDSEAAGGWRKFTGDQIGFILGCEIAENAAARARTEGREPAGVLACSIASSNALAAVAELNGLRFEQTLTGFKWISKVPNLIFGYEEALGYCLDPKHTPDKDGISAALVMANLAARLEAAGSNLSQHLDALFAKYGHWATSQITLRFESVQSAIDIVAKVRNQPPTSLDSQAVKFEDLAIPGGKLPVTDGLRFTLTDGRTALLRPSGTEPKLKCYLEAKGESTADANQRLSRLEAAFRELLGA
jgi:phosphomannomutase